VEKHVLHLTATLRARDVGVDVACPRLGALAGILESGGVQPMVAEIEAAGVGGDLGLKWEAVLTLADLCRRFKTDVVHTHTYSAAAHGVLAAREAGVRAVVHTAHSLRVHPAEVFLARLGGGQVVAVTGAGAKKLVGAGVAPQQVTVIPHGVKQRIGTQRHTELPYLNGLVIGSASRLDSAAGLDLLLQAASGWRRYLPAFTLLLVGDGPEAGDLRLLAADLGLQSRTVFAGDQGDPAALLGVMDVFVLPTREEAAPIACLQAMLAGKPVVATRVGGLEELVEHGSEGLLIPPEDPEAVAEAVLTLARDSALRHRLGRAARSRALSEFTLEREAERTQRLYRQLVEAQRVFAVPNVRGVRFDLSAGRSSRPAAGVRHPVVGPADLKGHPLDGEELAQPAPALPAKAQSLGRMGVQPGDRLAQPARVSRLGEETGHPVLHLQAHRPHLGGDNRQLVTHGFEHDQRHPLAPRAEKQEVNTTVEPGRVRDEARQADVGFEPKPVDGLPHLP
jgi:glycosyltransferase involved in cell wall biosynthesis